MLHERKARSCTYDAKRGTARLEIAPGGGAVKDAKATILLDARGAVVGVDVEPDEVSRTVVLVGRHEDVASTRRGTVSVTRDGSGTITSVEVPGVSG